MATLKKTDVELLHEIRDDNNVKSKEILWLRYQNKVYSHHYRYKKFYSVAQVSVEDFLQEAYLFFEIAIQKIDFEKMERTGSSFSTLFYWYLMKAKLHFVKEYKIHSKQVYMSEIFQDRDQTEHCPSSQLRKFNEATSSDFEESFDKRTEETVGRELIQSYVDQQGDREKEILQLYLESKKIADISKQLEIKYYEVYSYINRAKKEIGLLYKQQAII